MWFIEHFLSFQSLQADMEQGHLYLKTMREKTERVIPFLEEPEAEQLKEEVDIRLFKLEELMAALRMEHSSLEKCMLLSKDFMDKYKSQAQWVVETKNFLESSLEPKAELYQKKAQLAKYKVHSDGSVMLGLMLSQAFSRYLQVLSNRTDF